VQTLGRDVHQPALLLGRVLVVIWTGCKGGTELELLTYGLPVLALLAQPPYRHHVSDGWQLEPLVLVELSALGRSGSIFIVVTTQHLIQQLVEFTGDLAPWHAKWNFDVVGRMQGVCVLQLLEVELPYLALVDRISKQMPPTSDPPK
jgi:hypothetical protein